MNQVSKDNAKLATACAVSAGLFVLTRLARVGDVVDYESARWLECLGWHHLANQTRFQRFSRLATQLPEYRSLVHFRLRSLPLPIRILARTLWPGEKTLHIHTEHIEPGLFIQHGFATTITAESIGRDCWVNQQVTIGHTRKGKPSIGDFVAIGAGAVLVGPIVIGDNAQIGVNATVVKDVAAGAVMVAPQALRLR